MHLIFGALLIKRLPIKIYSASILFLGIYFIFKSKNKNNEAALWSAYMVGAEVFFRMSKGLFFYEFPKYSVLLFLFTGMLVEQRKHHVSISFLIYILLLLIGIAFVNIPYTESIRTNIAFNLSGPVVLGVSAIYFYRRLIPINTLFNMLFVMCLPIISMIGLLYMKTPDINDIVFGGVSNSLASGGYGPNQVSTLLGLGAFIFVIYLFFKKRFFSFFYLDILMLMYLIYRGLVTLSRGGMITAFLAISVFTYYYIISSEDKIKNILKYAGIIGVFGIGLWVYTSEVTGGMLMNRYTNKNAQGIEKEDVSAGRFAIFESELEGLYENPFFGLGVGGGKYYRLETMDLKIASHNELSRLLGEHGFIGIIILLILIIIPTNHILNQPYLARAFLASFFIFWFLTINHSAMRIAFPGFIYGLSLMKITKDEENTIHRK
tara:strand:- start:3610 stop:4911 length:1302 start_codon:yes stop_codon:yes gene_type:complete